MIDVATNPSLHDAVWSIEHVIAGSIDISLIEAGIVDVDKIRDGDDVVAGIVISPLSDGRISGKFAVGVEVETLP